MKKRLLTLGALALALATQAQTVYMGEGSTMEIKPLASVYCGGDWMMDGANTESSTFGVVNYGYVTIAGNYKKGPLFPDISTYNDEFLNFTFQDSGATEGGFIIPINNSLSHTGFRKYGQVKILSDNGQDDAIMSMYYSLLDVNGGEQGNSNYYNDVDLAFSFPFKDNAKYVMKSFTNGGTRTISETLFKGDCEINTPCDDRYKMTLHKWNNNKFQGDPVKADVQFKPGDYYLLNFREQEMKNLFSETMIPTGTPSGAPYMQEAKGIIHNLTEAQFTSVKYNTWKKFRNPYDETYESYMGTFNSEDRIYGKNSYRFGNPYTSNLDLSTVEGSNAWLYILNNSQEKTIKEATNANLIKNFTIEKRKSNYKYNWDSVVGISNGNGSYYKAQYDGTQWIGDAEALIVRPTETFNLKFPTINPVALGRTRVINVKAKFNNYHKTFDDLPSAVTTNNQLNPSPLINRSANTSSSANDFYQLELVLGKEKVGEIASAYLVGKNTYEETGETNANSDAIFLYGLDKEGKVAYDSKKTFNKFNTVSSVGKPLGVGFNNLETGATYDLYFKLFEKTIINQVKESATALFFLKDKKENKVIRIQPESKFTFVADADVATRFEIYWKEVPKGTVVTETKKEEKVDAVPQNTNSQTVVYTEAGQNKLRFENISKTADIEVFNASGRLEFSVKSVPTSSDYILNVHTQGLHLVNVKYQNGETKTLKFINK